MRTLGFSLLLLMALSFPLLAQNRLPQEYTSPDEIVTLSADMTFEQAFIILSKIAYQKAGKTIIDPLKRQGRIDVDIVNLPWKKALEVILKAHRLGYREHEKFYEVVGETEQVDPNKMQITSTSREVRIEAIFFEGDRGALAEAGIDWSFLSDGNTLSAGFTVNGANDVSSEIVEGNLSYSAKANGADVTLSSLLRAFESKNLGRILAQPKVVVLSGKQGRIQVGQDFSIKTRDFAGNIIDNFFSTGTILTVTPVTYADGGMNFIHLIIHAERSSAIPDPVSTTINKSEAETQVLLLDGESTLVGGLYIRDYQTVRKGVPYLKDLPWWVLGLRYFFGFNKTNTTDKELLVVLRASLIPELKLRAAGAVKSTNELFQQEQSGSNQRFEEHWEGQLQKEKEKEKESKK